MQYGRDGFYGDLYNWFGDYPAAFALSVGTNNAILEGDAIAAETAFTNSGRGRMADFLAYYRMAFDRGDMRNWYRWRYGSRRYYTPDYYRIGYMTVAGVRAFFDAPLFMETYVHRASDPWHFNALSHSLRQYTGKGISGSWKLISAEYARMWKEQDELRQPFQDLDILVPQRKLFTAYSWAVQAADGKVYAVRGAMDRTEELVTLGEDGKIEVVRPFAGSSRLVYSPLTDCIYWSESKANPRWTAEEDSRIMMMKNGEKSITAITGRGRYANPAVSEDGSLLAAAKYPYEGHTCVVLLDMQDGHELKSLRLPDGVQVQELAFIGEEVLMICIKYGGAALYMTDFQDIRQVAGPFPYKIADLISRDGKAYFSCDKSGISEIYCYDGTLTRLTNTRYGASCPFFRDSTLVFSALRPEGKVLAVADGQFSEITSWESYTGDPIADKLAAQEGALEKVVDMAPVPEPKRYRKGLNFLHFHSWIPLYVNTDNFSATPTDYLYQTVSLGVTGLFQNVTGTASGSLGVSVHRNPFNREKWIGGVHARLRYTGFFPVFDFAVDAGDRPWAEVMQGVVTGKDTLFISAQEHTPWSLYVGGKARVSVPLNFSSGGWERTLEPYISVMASNDWLSYGYVEHVYNITNKQYEPKAFITKSFRSTYDFRVGITGEVALPVAMSAIYPRFGLSGMTQVSCNTYNTTIFAGCMAFLPGLANTHGIRLGAYFQKKFPLKSNGQSAEDVWMIGTNNMAPRGYVDTGMNTLLNYFNCTLLELSVDYAMPLWSMDFAIGSHFYIKSLDLIPFVEATYASNPSGQYPFSGSLLSTGTDLVFNFEKLLTAVGPIKLGLRFAYNDGSLWKLSSSKNHFYFGTIAQYDLF